MTRLTIDRLTITYGQNVAVSDLSLEVDGPGLTVLVGPSGCGKTSLLRAVAGFEVPTAGRIEIDGDPMVGPSTFVAPEKRRLGLVFQQGALFPHLDVWHNVLYGLRGFDDAETRAAQAIERVGMTVHRDRHPDQLSGGEQQRVALARALAPAPRLLLLDEPFASLDAGLRRRLGLEVRDIVRAAGATAILVTHDLEEALSLGDTVVVLRAGEVLQKAAPEALYAQPASLAVARLVGDGQLLACHCEGPHAQSPFGPLTVHDARPTGPALVLVRPEDLRLLAEDESAGVPGRVMARTFYGHDCVDAVELADGSTLRARSFTGSRPAVGAAVRLAIRGGAFAVFDDPEPAGAAVRPLEDYS